MAQFSFQKLWLIGVCKMKVLCRTKSRSLYVSFILTGPLKTLFLITHLRIRSKQPWQPYPNRMLIYLPESPRSRWKEITSMDYQYLKHNTLPRGGSHRLFNRWSRTDSIYQQLYSHQNKLTQPFTLYK